MGWQRGQSKESPRGALPRERGIAGSGRHGRRPEVRRDRDVASNRARRQAPDREGSPQGQGAGASFFSGIFLDEQENTLARRARRFPENHPTKPACETTDHV